MEQFGLKNLVAFSLTALALGGTTLVGAVQVKAADLDDYAIDEQATFDHPSIQWRVVVEENYGVPFVERQVVERRIQTPVVEHRVVEQPILERRVVQPVVEHHIVESRRAMHRIVEQEDALVPLSSEPKI
jgi:hypothetical protein